MPGKRHQWPDCDEARTLLADCTSWEDAALKFNAPRTSVQAFCRRNKLGGPSKGKNTDYVFDSSIDVPSERELGKIRELVIEEGLNPDEWIATRIRLNRYGDGIEQRRVDLTPREDLLMPVRSDGWRPPRKARVTPSEGLVALFPDQHAPLHDPLIHEAACQWIKDAKPEKIVCLGDLTDNPSVSRHRRTGHEPKLKECLQGGYDLLRGYAEAVVAGGGTVGPGGTEIILLPGNHDEERIRNTLADKGLAEIANLTQVGSDVPITSLEHLMRLDELGVRVERPPDGYGYDHAEHRVTPNLLAVHGWIAKKGSGASALATLDRVNENVVQGHTHRQALVHVTKWIGGTPFLLTAVEAGTMALMEQSALGYANRPDWQGGWAVAEDHGDHVTFDFATRNGNRVYWRGTSYQ
jgi:predicted phosphodiesterase